MSTTIQAKRGRTTYTLEVTGVDRSMISIVRENRDQKTTFYFPRELLDSYLHETLDGMAHEMADSLVKVLRRWVQR